MRRSEARDIRRMLDNLIAMIPMADESEFNSSAAVINENAAAIRVWRADKDYARGAIVLGPEDNVPYWALHDNGKTAGQVHQPSVSPTVWVHCHGTSAQTARPFVAEGHNPYNKGHTCTENGVVFVCVQDGNVFAPSVYPSAWETV